MLMFVFPPGLRSSFGRIPRKCESTIRFTPPWPTMRIVLPGALARQPLDRAKRARQDLIERLAARPGDEAVVAPVRETASLVERRPGAVADVDLSKLGQG